MCVCYRRYIKGKNSEAEMLKYINYETEFSKIQRISYV